jgi:hypothetical protein
MGNPFVHVELMTSELEKSKDFYRTLFDWKLEEVPGTGYTMIDVGEGTGGGMMKHPMPGEPPRSGWRTSRWTTSPLRRRRRKGWVPPLLNRSPTSPPARSASSPIPAGAWSGYGSPRRRGDASSLQKLRRGQGTGSDRTSGASPLFLCPLFLVAQSYPNLISANVPLLACHPRVPLSGIHDSDRERLDSR